MVAKAKGLGRGFESLIPTDVIAEEFDVTSEVDGKVSELRELKLEDIVRDEGQPRKHFDKVALEELAASIQEHGVLQPIVVVKVGKKYQIVAGERRYRASQIAEMETIPAIVRTLDAQNKLELSIIENAQREDLNPIELATAYAKLKEQFNLKNDMQVSVLARCPEVFVMEEQQEDEKEIRHLLEQAVCGACERFVEARAREGEALKEDLIQKLDGILETAGVIEERFPQILAEYRQKLEAKVRELLADAQVDENRIVTEVTIFADKICVDEEIVRLKSHVEAMKSALKTGGSIGRKLDFIAQEMNREANTTLSKANDLEVSNCAIDLKTAIEKVREQIQNIE